MSADFPIRNWPWSRCFSRAVTSIQFVRNVSTEEEDEHTINDRVAPYMVHGICFADGKTRLADDDSNLAFVVESLGKSGVCVDVFVGPDNAGLAFCEDRGEVGCSC